MQEQGHFSQSKSEKEWGQSQSSRQGKFDICQYCAGPSHPRLICPASNKQCSRNGCGRIRHFARACRIGAPPLVNPFEVMNTKQQARHLDTTLSEDCEDYGTELYVDLIPEKYAQSVFSTAEDQRDTRVGRKFFSHLKRGLTKDMTKSIRIQLDTASTCNTLAENLALSFIPPGKKLEDFVTPSRATLFTYDNSKLTPLGKLELLAETATGYHLLTFHILRDLQIPRKSPLLCSPGVRENLCKSGPFSFITTSSCEC